MWKKTLILLSLFAFILTLAAPLMEDAEAKPRFSSGKRSFTTTPKKADDNVMQNNSGSGTGTTGGTAARNGTGTAGTAGGALGGGGFLKGMAVGGLAGLLLGGMLGTGFFAEMIGFLINAAAIVLLFMIAMYVYNRFIHRKQQQQQPDPRNRGY
jgi:predicted lipid-binding transport protein (Tim44 family)